MRLRFRQDSDFWRKWFTEGNGSFENTAEIVAYLRPGKWEAGASHADGGVRPATGGFSINLEWRMRVSRREVVMSAIAVPLVAATKLKIVVTGGHPGDPECGCGGTIARYTALGHDVVLVYLNRGEGFCSGGGACGAIRTAEAQNACRILKARAVFCDQTDGQAVVDNARYQTMRRLLDSERPDVVFCQWPIDVHRDHRAVSMLVMDAWLQGGRKYALYYYEVAQDSMMFTPTEFVDVSDAGVEAARRAACYAHVSQQPDKWYPAQVEVTRFRGSQSGHSQSEAFLRHWESKAAFLP
jgi:LmbE family N-acetylglucosaminyl deacetylase